MADLATLQTRLSEAEDAHHKLMTGASEVSISDGENTATYQQINASKLMTYIQGLRAEIRALGGTVASARRTSILPRLY